MNLKKFIERRLEFAKSRCDVYEGNSYKGFSSGYWSGVYSAWDNLHYRLKDMGQVSDGYHTYNELYYHRMILFSVVCKNHKDKAWKSWKHHDNTMYEDYFIVGVETPEGSFTYHYHKDHWDLFQVEERDLAPEWDGHTAHDVTRLLSLEE